MNVRQLQPEIMDDPGLDGEQHFQALRGLARLNRWSRSASIVWPEIQKLAGQLPGQTIRILDVATGGGDIPIGIYQRALLFGLKVQISGWDLSPRAVNYARQRAREANAQIEYFEFNALQDDWPQEYDVILSSLFLHHLETEKAERLLSNMAKNAKKLVLINDLLRTRSGLMLAKVATRLLSSSGVVHADGPQSVRAAFTLEEIRVIAERAGLHGFTLKRRWPCRFLLTWARNL